MKLVIIGGGLVGAAAALAAAKQGYQVDLVEYGAAPSPPDPSQPWHLRISAVHQRNVDWLERLGVWQHVHAERFLAYTDLSVATQDGVEASFSAASVDLPALGRMVENEALVYALWQCLAQHAQVTLHTETAATEFDWHRQTVTLSSGQTLDFDLVLGADGQNSVVAKAAQIGYRGWHYDTRCMLAYATTAQAVPAHTWQRFRQRGPFAVLPLSSHAVCLIDYRSEQEWRDLQKAKQVETALKEQFESYLGDLTIGNYASFPITRQRALSYTRFNKVALLGDAAHSIHPLAGQGLNLGFADIQCLFNELDKQPLTQALASYERQQTQVNQVMMRAMDAIHYGFQSRHWLVRGALNLGLSVAQRAGFVKKQIVKMALGVYR